MPRLSPASLRKTTILNPLALMALALLYDPDGTRIELMELQPVT
jgi:hypothetical protein